MAESRGCIVVTGASSGLGLRVANQLCELGREVVLACRSLERGEAAARAIRARLPDAPSPTVLRLDLADVASVHAFVEAFRAGGKRLAALVCNAGVSPYFGDTTRRALPANGWETTMAVNHLGHFLLTNLLLRVARDAARSGDGDVTTAPLRDLRVVVVASSIVENARVPPIDVDDLAYDRPGAYRDGKQAYKHSKEANVLFALELARRLASEGAHVNCLCPGFMPETELFRESGAALSWIMKNVLDSFVGRKLLPITSLDEGARRVLDLVVGAKGGAVTGAYFKNGEVAQLPPHLCDAANQRRLWESSERLLGISGLTLPPPAAVTSKEPLLADGRGGSEDSQAASNAAGGVHAMGTSDDQNADHLAGQQSVAAVVK